MPAHKPELDLVHSLREVHVGALIWLAVALLLAALVAGYFYAPTRPYVVKYWWVAVAVVAPLVAVAFLRRRGGNPIDTAIEDGRAIAEGNNHAIDRIIDHAVEQAARADAELARRRIDNWADKAVFDEQLKAVNGVENSYERRKALIKLVESTRDDS